MPCAGFVTPDIWIPSPLLDITQRSFIGDDFQFRSIKFPVVSRDWFDFRLRRNASLQTDYHACGSALIGGALRLQLRFRVSRNLSAHQHYSFQATGFHWNRFPDILKGRFVAGFWALYFPKEPKLNRR